ncbi:Hsp20/alpha crystallin family protein [Agrobacterium tumefaciens]|uniref:Hsp20/alpha crystallin family protein n=1 Tax=Agrobacterium tumefaciens TaxID=358 RepID=UPI002A10CAC1|nr:Hsp20/alpha crystallin family protein [Agrobacterium tumefaciens]MDX8327074.1 Hsp20/alpha crystallin family protein [Agrobacterium tumefaciens]
MAEAPTKLPVKTVETPVKSAGNFWSSLQTLRSEIDRLFDGFAPTSRNTPDRSFFGGTFSDLNGWSTSLAVDLVEKDDTYEVIAECPGLDAKNIEVELSNGLLTIRGEKREEKEDKQKEYHVSERRYGSFQRSFSLPVNVDADKVAATFENGILKVRLPKSAEAKKNQRKIEIKAA